MLVRKNDIGTRFRITITDGRSAIDISDATTKQIRFKKPISSSLETKDADFSTDGTDGKMEYIAEEGLLDEFGIYKIEAYIVTPSGAWSSNIGTFAVEDILEE